MKRVYICIGIFLSIIAISAASLNILKKSNNELFYRIDEISSIYQTNPGLAAAKVEELEEFWEKYYLRISFVAHSSTLNDISTTMSKLPSLLENDSEEFMSELLSIKHWAQLVYINQFPYLHSVF